jgi:hypothetical protein
MSTQEFNPVTYKKSLSVINDIMIGFVYSKALSEICTLGVADIIKKNGPQTAEQLVDAMSSPDYHIPCHAQGVPLPHYLYRTMRAVSFCGVFDEVKDGNEDKFALNDVSALLCTDEPLGARWIAAVLPGRPCFEMWATYSEIIRTGKHGAAILRGDPSCFKWFKELPEEEFIFMSSMKQSNEFNARSMKKTVDFSSFSKVVDIGGGYGQILKKVLESNPKAQGVLFDQPHVAEKSKKDNANDEILGDSSRVEYVGGNFFEAVPEGDAYTISRIIHDWNDEQCILILQNCVKSMKGDNGRIFVVDIVMPDFASGKKELDEIKYFYDLHMMVACGALERTEAEFRELYSRAGLEIVKINHMEGCEMAVTEIKKKN